MILSEILMSIPKVHKCTCVQSLLCLIHIFNDINVTKDNKYAANYICTWQIQTHLYINMYSICISK